MKNCFIILILITFFFSCIGQNHNKDAVNNMRSNSMSVFGRWKCVVIDYRGYQKFSIEEAKNIEKSVFVVGKHKMYYEGIASIELCEYDTLVGNIVDTSALTGASFEYKYSKDDLSKIIQFAQLNKRGELPMSCYNECSQLFLKEDTLINICGGYTFYLTKIDNKKNYAGTGNSTIDIKVDYIDKIKISYLFYKDDDQLTIEDNRGKILTVLNSKNISKTNTAIISTMGNSSLVFKIKSSTAKSRWKFSVEW